MFIVTQKPTFMAPVVANIPADGGRFNKVRFTVEFKALSKTDVDALLQRIRDRSKADTSTDVTDLTDRDVLDELLVGFGPDLLNEDKTPMAFTPDNVDKLCAIWPIEGAIVKSFFDNYVSGPAKN